MGNSKTNKKRRGVLFPTFLKGASRLGLEFSLDWKNLFGSKPPIKTEALEGGLEDYYKGLVYKGLDF